MQRLKSLRKKSTTKMDAEVPQIPEAVPEVPDVNALKDAAEDKAGDLKDMAADAVPGDMKFLLFKMWLIEKFSCCLGTPEMTKMGVLDTPDMDDVLEQVPGVPQVVKF